MSRAYDISDFAAFLRKYGDSGRDSESRKEEPSRDASQRTRPDRGRNQESTLSRNGYDRSRTIYRSRNREYSLRESEVQTLNDLGKFRMVPADDLARFAYRGDRSQMDSDLRNLRRQGLIEQRSIEGHSSYSTKVLTLTKDAHRLLERAQLVSHRQTIYHGLVKPKEARHDADLYRLYHKVAREIADVGGKVRRVVLDYELKQELYRKLSRVDPNKELAYERIRVANEYDLKVVNDKIPVPDLRIEYEDECRELRRLDLEIASRKSLGAVIARGNFEVQASEFSALVLVLDAKVGDRNLVVHNFEIVFVGDPDSLVGQLLIGIDPGQLPEELLFELVVKDDTANLAAHISNLSGDLVIEAVEIGVVAGFFGLDQAVIDRLAMGDELGSLKEPVGVLRQCQNSGRVGRVALNAALFDEPLPAKTAEVAVHLREIAAVSELREIVCGNHAELAQVGEGLDFRLPQAVLAVATAIDRSRSVVSVARQCGF